MTKIITIGLSDQNFTIKPHGKQVGSLAFTVTTLTTNELLSKLTQGYCIAHVFGHDNTFSMRDKNNSNFTSASFISVDVDNSDVDMYTYIQTLTNKPTIAYTTFSNLMEGKGYRFRLIYVLSKDVTTVERYKDCYDYFTKGMNLKDNCMHSAAQFIIGTSQNAETYTSDSVYSLEDIPTLYHSNFIIKEMRHYNTIIKETVKIDEAFLNDFYTMKYSDFIMKYKDVYPFFTSTPLPSVSEDVPYILLPSNYLEIKRYWCMDKVINDKGEVERTYYNRVRRLKDGQGRRKKLYINAILRRMMMADITVEYLITMLANELYYYVNNSTDKITKQDIVTIATNAYRADLSKYNELRVQKHPTFIVNPSYCEKYGCGRKTARNVAKKMLLWNKIGELYDCDMSDKDNIRVMRENGINVSRTSLYRFKQEQGLTRMFHSNSINKEEQVHYKVRLKQTDVDTEEMFHSNSIIKKEQVHYKVRFTHSVEDEKNNDKNTEMSNSNSINNIEQVHYKVRTLQIEKDEENDDKNTMFHSNSIINKEEQVHYKVRLAHSDYDNTMYQPNLILKEEENKEETNVQTRPKEEDAKMTEEEKKEKRMKAKANIEELLRRYESITDSDALIQKYPIVMEYIRGKKEYLTQAESSIYLLKANQISRKIRR